jgi:Flp pilus assembly protein TadG
MNITGHKPTWQRNSIGSDGRSESGQGLAEVGILVPVLVLLLVGIVDFSRIFMVRHVITNAAREGARVAAAADSTTSSQAAQAVQSILQGGGVSANQATVSISGTTAAAEQPATVTITYPMTSMALRMLCVSNTTVSLSSTSSVPHE